MKNWTIAKRVILGFAAILATTVALGFFARMELRNINAAVAVLTKSNIPSL